MGKIKHREDPSITQVEFEADSMHLDSQGNALELSRSATLVVATSDSSAKSKAGADYVCGDGTYANDDEYIQAAIDALPA